MFFASPQAEMLQRVYAHRVHTGEDERFAISAPESGISENFKTESEFEAAMEKLGFPAGFGRQVLRALKRRGIVSLDLEPGIDPGVLKA
jgi:hypothetical protein